MPTLTFLNVVEGDKSMFFEDEMPEKRAELAQRVLELQKSGYALFLIHSKDAWRIRGYDDKENEWILMSSPIAAPRQRETREEATMTESTAGTPIKPGNARRMRRTRAQSRTAAQGTEASAVAPTAGG